ncbi:lantibiotic dehydratase [Frankia sp. AgB1.9]|uniref:lantibiotic dehydratase n=1 Tax=unclassified Frankia TaxID=2632575 RepID=UPI001933CF94|nr:MULTISPECIES: lantibiotic dehydratase [unclassified Frankia]MBL7487886.1 lantibiotic dehydratase [Frankia sp. AgW1.1]MBL7549951.1 lantibiotic dehydratase [Frankia sp. AgB1.9]MBL7621470.1 lantibiotic dehydratase [Frankia sp. AgB1.8]
MFQAADAALIRAASYPQDLTLPAWPDLTTDQPDAWMVWLRQVWALPEFAATVGLAAPDLTAQLTRMLASEPMETRRLRRVVETTVRYLLRWTSRATPFGRFAGVAPVEFGPHAAVRWGQQHQEVARLDDRLVAEYTAAAERDLATLREVTVVTNSLGYRRGGAWVLPCSRSGVDRVWDVEIDLTGPVRLTIETASTPIEFRKLAATVAAELGSEPAAEGLLAALIHAGVLLSEIRPPMTVTEPATHLGRRIALPDPAGRIAVDLRVDCSVTLPPAVIRATQDAADALVAVAPHLPGWFAYHRAFLERWGPGAAVPLREVLRDLGFPASYRGSPHRDQALFTARDSILTTLAQQSALDGGTEVAFDDGLIAALHGDDDRPPIPHTELRFTLAAATPDDLDRGAFTLTVMGGSRHAGVAAGRFLRLLTPAELETFRSVYTSLPTAIPGAETVQLSGPPLNTRLATLARTPELLPLLPVGDFHPDPRWTLADLAVAGDGQRLWLVSLATGRPVEPLLLNSVRLATLQQPLIRFLTEIWTAWTAPCARFDWGRAHRLPFLPRLRRGRAILHPARWTIPATALPARTAPWPQWHAAWQRHRERHRLPRHVLVGQDDIQLHLDLDETTHLALLRSHLDRHPRTALTEAPGPAGWIDGRPAELLLTLAQASPAHRPTRRQARPVSTLTHQPGRSQWLDARLRGHCDHIVARLAAFADPLASAWWFLRYPHPEPQVRLRIPLRDPAQFAAAAHDLAGWAQELRDDGLLIDYTLATYRPETRWGHGSTLAAAETVFAADSHAACRRLSGDRQASTAAGMITIVRGFTGGPDWLIDRVPHGGGSHLDPSQLTCARLPIEDENLATALTTYRTLADRDGLEADQLLADLLHLHHARMIGVDMASERHCLRLARAVVHADLARRAS